MTRPLDIVILGLSLSSSWGNGHATTYRALSARPGGGGPPGPVPGARHAVVCSEPRPAGARFLRLRPLRQPRPTWTRWRDRIARADAVIVGSYVPEGDRAARHAGSLDARSPGLLRHRHARHARGAGHGRRGIPGAAAIAADRPLPLLRGRRGAGPAAQSRRTAGGDAAIAPSIPTATDRWTSTTRWDLGYLGTYSPDRQPGLEELLIEPARRLPDARFVVAGSQYPETIDWPENVERIDHLAPPDHAAFYNAQRFTLNLTRAAMRATGHPPRSAVRGGGLRHRHRVGPLARDSRRCFGRTRRSCWRTRPATYVGGTLDVDDEKRQPDRARRRAKRCSADTPGRPAPANWPDIVRRLPAGTEVPA